MTEGDEMSLPNHAQLVKEVRDLAELRAEEHAGLLAIIGDLSDRLKALEGLEDAPLLRIAVPTVPVEERVCPECGSLIEAGHFDSCPRYVAPVVEPSATLSSVTG